MLKRAENLVLAAALASMALLPVAEILLRALLRVGISGAASFTQHFALIAGMLGAAVAAREQRLLSLSTLDSLLVGRSALLARLFTRTVAVIVGALLCLASVELVLAERAGGNVIAYGIPVWLGQLALPLGFAAIAWRLAWSAADDWRARLAALVLAAAAAATAAARARMARRAGQPTAADEASRSVIRAKPSGSAAWPSQTGMP